jgi:eukaryotic-like serine/threonine-protein kinase
MPCSDCPIRNLQEHDLASENLLKALERRERLSEREKFEIESDYYNFGTGDTEKAQQRLEIWAQTYSKDWMPRNSLGAIFLRLGKYEKALAEFREALRPNPGSGAVYGNIIDVYRSLNRVEDARTTADKALAKNVLFAPVTIAVIS